MPAHNTHQFIGEANRAALLPPGCVRPPAAMDRAHETFAGDGRVGFANNTHRMVGEYLRKFYRPAGGEGNNGEIVQSAEVTEYTGEIKAKIA